jgi:UDP-N-acetylglucosamine transferase subunit ALG13
MKEAELVVAHAGMGSIITALRYQRPLLIMPRRAALGEHRNDHQVATAKWLIDRPGIEVAWDESELPACLNARHEWTTGTRLPEFADGPLVKRLTRFIKDTWN